jgi:hypothetical protein
MSQPVIKSVISRILLNEQLNPFLEVEFQTNFGNFRAHAPSCNLQYVLSKKELKQLTSI